MRSEADHVSLIEKLEFYSECGRKTWEGFRARENFHLYDYKRSLPAVLKEDCRSLDWK